MDTTCCGPCSASEYVNNPIGPRQQHEVYFAYKIRIQKLYNIKICVYTAPSEGKKELFEPVDDFDKDRKDVTILVWGNHGETWSKTQCALIKNIEILLDRPNKMNHKFYYCDRCTYCFNSQITFDNHICSHSLKPEIVCPKKKKHITFINEHKLQNIKHNITADTEC